MKEFGTTPPSEPTPLLQVKAPRVNKTSIASLSCAELRSASRHPPTPLGSTGCESASGFPPCSPHLRIQVVLRSPRGSPRGSPPPCKMTGLCSSGLGFAFVCPKDIKRPLRDDFLTQNTISSAQKAPAGRFSGSKYNFIRPKGPCGTTFCYSQSEIYDIGTKILLLQ